jgi:uncharacterized membrane protein YjfL (UPF0719 family)
MNWVTIGLALFEFVLTAALALLVVYVNYRLFIATNRDYDAEEEMKKNNHAVAVLLAALLLAGGAIVREGIYPTVNLVRLYFTAPVPYLTAWQVLALSFAHLGLVFVVAVYTMSLSLRFWGRLTSHIQNAEELKRGNTSVGIVLAGVVLVVALFISDGISRLTKAMIPQPSIGHVEFMR